MWVSCFKPSLLSYILNITVSKEKSLTVNNLCTCFIGNFGSFDMFSILEYVFLCTARVPYCRFILWISVHVHICILWLLLCFAASKVASTKQCSGKIIVRSKNSLHKLIIPIRLQCFTGLSNYFTYLPIVCIIIACVHTHGHFWVLLFLVNWFQCQYRFTSRTVKRLYISYFYR